MLDIVRLMYDESEKYTVPSNVVATFKYKGKAWRAVRVDDPKNFRGRGWFLSDTIDPGSSDPDRNSLALFLEDPEKFARYKWAYDSPGWGAKTGKFSDHRFSREWENATFLRFEEVDA